MEIRYKRTYTPARGKRYTAGEIGAMLGYALEIADPRVKLKEGKLSPGEICMLLFGLTPEEYALKDSDPKALDALADKLLKHVPADRLMGWRIMDLKGATVQKAVQPQTGESIDSGAFAQILREKTIAANAGPIDVQLLEVRRLQKLCADKGAPDGVKQDWLAARKALGAALLNLERMWMLYDAPSGDRWPAVGFDGRLEIFTTRDRAQRVHSQLTAANGGAEFYSLREITGASIEKLLSACAGDGLDLMRIDNGFAAAELSAKDFMNGSPQPNALLRSMILREIQYGMRVSRLKEAKAPEKQITGALESMLTLRNFAWRELGNAKLYAACAGGDQNRCVIISGKDSPEKLLAVFTARDRAEAFAARLNPPARPVELTFDEIVTRSAVCGGLLVDVGFIGYRLPKAEYDKVRELRAKPPMVVRIQQPQPQQPPAPKAESAQSLPNPDDFMPAAQPEAPVEPEPTPQDVPKKGFFKKLFGK